MRGSKKQKGLVPPANAKKAAYLSSRIELCPEHLPEAVEDIGRPTTSASLGPSLSLSLTPSSTVACTAQSLCRHTVVLLTALCGQKKSEEGVSDHMIEV